MSNVVHLATHKARIVKKAKRLTRTAILEDLSKDAIVTYQTYKVRLRGTKPTEKQVRQLRWIWMRGNLTTNDLPGLKWMQLGGLVGRGLLSIPEHGKLRVTREGVNLLLGRSVQ